MPEIEFSEIALDHLGQPTTPEVIRAHAGLLSEGGPWVLNAISAGQVVASLCYGFQPCRLTGARRDTLWLFSAYTAPAFRRTGLLARLVALARADYPDVQVDGDIVSENLAWMPAWLERLNRADLS